MTYYVHTDGAWWRLGKTAASNYLYALLAGGGINLDWCGRRLKKAPEASRRAHQPNVIRPGVWTAEDIQDALNDLEPFRRR